MEKYYVKVSGEQGPKVPHKTLAEAYTEARRLFEITGQSRRVYVLQVIGTIEPEKVAHPINEQKPNNKAARRKLARAHLQPGAV